MVSPQGGWRRDRGRARWPGNSNCGQILHGMPSWLGGWGSRLGTFAVNLSMRLKLSSGLHYISVFFGYCWKYR